MKPIYTHNRNGVCSATDRDGNRYRESSFEHQYEEGHQEAARGLAEKMGWTGILRGHHHLKAGRNDGMVWVWDDPHAPKIELS